MAEESLKSPNAPPPPPPPPLPSPTPTLPHLSHFVTVKLTNDNFLLWRTQMVPYLCGQRLLHFVDGSVLPPPPYLSDQITPNPEFIAWTQTDQLILSALISSLSDNLIAQVVGHSIARDVWKALDKLFTSHSHARVIQLRYQLAIVSKGSSLVSDYFRKVKHLSDTMSAAGTPLSSEEFISYLLAGLNSEYDAFVTSVTTRVDPLSPNELYGLLLTHENRLSHSTLLPLSTDLSANFTTSSARGRGPYRGTYRGSSRGRGRGRSAPTFSSTSSTNLPSPLPHSKPSCQVCGKVGHIALKCYYRFDHSYQSDPPKSLTAHYTTSASSPSMDWYPDTAATNHITSDLANLNLHSAPYGGNDQIRVGDGSALPISNIVKDSKTGITLLRGPTHDGLYSFPSAVIPPSPQALVGERTSSFQWHARLGHPALRLVHRIITAHSLPVTHHDTPQVCPACCQAKSSQLPFRSSHQHSTSLFN